MSQDIAKAFKLNGTLVQTGRDELREGELVMLSGFGRSARVTVTVEPPLSASSASPVVLGPGEVTPVVAGMRVTVKVRARD